MRSLISSFIFMQNDMCCTRTGIRRWCCPTFVSIVAGLIMVVAGSIKLVHGKAMMTMVGGMALQGLAINPTGMDTFALVLGAIAAVVEVVGGISFMIGCRKTSKYSALLLAFIILLARLAKLQHLPALQGNWFDVSAGVLGQIQTELLLFAIFIQKGMKLFCRCKGGACGVPAQCCMSSTQTTTTTVVQETTAPVVEKVTTEVQ